MYMIQKKFGPLVKEAASKHDIDKVYGDKAHDNRNNFNTLDKINAEPAIKIRKNASVRSKGCGVDPYFWEHFSHFHIDTIFFHYQYLSPSSSPLQYLVAFSILK